MTEWVLFRCSRPE